MKVSVPSPSPYDTIIEKDENGKRIKIGGEYKKIQKRYYVEYDHELFRQYKEENAELIEEYLYSQGKKTNLTTFNDYRPYYVQQTGLLTQFACDTCSEWEFAKTGLTSKYIHIHHCGTRLCPSYLRSVGQYCTCVNCEECHMTRYSKLTGYALVQELCCGDGSDTKLLCAEGKYLTRKCGANK